VRFQVIAAPGRPGGLLSYLPAGAYEPLTGTRIKPVPETPYDVTVIKLQYDALASWPDRIPNSPRMPGRIWPPVGN
jgi:hypothetical protein